MDVHHSAPGSIVRLAAAALAVVAATPAAALGPASGDDPTTTRFAYAPHEFGSSLGGPQGRPDRKVAPTGAFAVLVSGRSFWLRIDDAGDGRRTGALPGPVQVVLWDGQRHHWLCHPLGVLAEHRVPKAGSRVHLTLLGPSARLYPYVPGCRGTVTTGVATVLH